MQEARGRMQEVRKIQATEGCAEWNGFFNFRLEDCGLVIMCGDAGRHTFWLKADG